MECELSVFSVVAGAAVVLEAEIFAENACLLTAFVDNARVVTPTSSTTLFSVVVVVVVVDGVLVVVDVVVVEVELLTSTC